MDTRINFMRGYWKLKNDWGMKRLDVLESQVKIMSGWKKGTTRSSAHLQEIEETIIVGAFDKFYRGDHELGSVNPMATTKSV